MANSTREDMPARTLVQEPRVLALVAQGVAFLSARPGVKRVWLFGSAAKGRRLDWRSDLDFAVEGLPAAELCRTWSELDVVLRHAVDLVRWEEASEFLRQQIRQWGVVLYEA